MLSNRQLGVSLPTGQHPQSFCNIWSNHGDTADEAGYGRKEIAEQDKQSVKLNDEANEGPAQEYQGDADSKGSGASPFLSASEEETGLIRSDDDSEAYEEEDLRRRKNV